MFDWLRFKLLKVKRVHDPKYDFPSDYLTEVGWCQEVVSCIRDENGIATAYTIEGAIDAWARANGGSKYVMPLKLAVKRQTKHPITTFWNDSAQYKSEVIRVLRAAEDDVFGEDDLSHTLDEQASDGVIFPQVRQK